MPYALIQKALAAPLRFVQRLSLAARYYRRLNYSWHLAWAKSAR